MLYPTVVRYTVAGSSCKAVLEEFARATFVKGTYIILKPISSAYRLLLTDSIEHDYWHNTCPVEDQNRTLWSELIRKYNANGFIYWGITRKEIISE